jgi:hypothetical protein
MLLFFLLAIASVQGNFISKNETVSPSKLEFTSSTHHVTEKTDTVRGNLSNCTEQESVKIVHEERTKPSSMPMFNFIYKALQNIPNNQNVTEVKQYSMQADSMSPQQLYKVDKMFYQSPQKWLAFKNSAKMNFLKSLTATYIGIEDAEYYAEKLNMNQSNVRNLFFQHGTQPYINWNRSRNTNISLPQSQEFSMVNTTSRKTALNETDILITANSTMEIFNETSHQRFKRQDDNMKLKIVQEVYSTLPIGKAYVAKKHHYFRKEVPFEQMFSE